MKMLVAIDGAGGFIETEEEYAVRYEDSWTHRICLRASERNHYVQAQNIVWGDVYTQAMEVAFWVLEHTSEEDEIAFVGYSRGGATCYLSAALLTHSVHSSLEERNIVAMGLFDPVANQLLADSVCSQADFENTTIYIARAETPNLLFPPIEVNTPNAEIRIFEGNHSDLGGQSNYIARDAYIWIGNMLEDHEFINFSSP